MKVFIVFAIFFAAIATLVSAQGMPNPQMMGDMAKNAPQMAKTMMDQAKSKMGGKK